MARFEPAAAALEAAIVWRDRCLVEDGSLFTDKRLWSPTNLDHLRRFFVERPDQSKRDFLTKLEDQLRPAPPEAKQLAAEMIWGLYLFVNRIMAPETKRIQIRRIWEWSGEPLPEKPLELGRALSRGIGSPGTAYQMRRWAEFQFFIEAMENWKKHDRHERQQLLSDPWRFAVWLDSLETGKNRQFRHVLLYYLFPDTFEGIASGENKRQIIRAFSKDLSDYGSIDLKNRIEVDRALLVLRQRLQERTPDDALNFYDPDVRQIWSSVKGGKRAFPGTEPQPGLGDDGTLDRDKSSADLDRWYREKFNDARVWLIAAGEGGRLWPDFQSVSLIAIGEDELGDLSFFSTREQLQEDLSELRPGKARPIMDSLACWEFLPHVMRRGDYVIVKKGTSTLLGYGKITGDYEYRPEREEYDNVRTVEWLKTGAWNLSTDNRITAKALTDLTNYKEWLKFAIELIESSRRAEKPVGPGFGPDEALRDVFIPREEFTAILDNLARKKALILEGPPGVGKSFVARRIAYCMIGRQAPENVQMIQFHQSYSYEDFVQGWRPNRGGGFELKNGVFYEFCKKAAACPESNFVFIIDEINRGNLSKIFGELMLLIEGDKRTSDYAVPLTYSSSADDRFMVPPNLYLLGMMNTADRSLAMVDYALRRRFAFSRLRPAYSTEEFSEYLVDRSVPEEVVSRIINKMESLNEMIRQESRDLGAGFEIGHSFFCPIGTEEDLGEAWYSRIVHTEIAPLLHEYWFDDPEKARRQVDALLQ